MADTQRRGASAGAEDSRQSDTRLIGSLEQVAGGYDVLLCDLWGCFHNGVAPFPGAVAATRRFRERGGAVVMLTNAPRSNEAVAAQLDALGAPRDCYDAIVSSGDATRDALQSGAHGRRVHFVGPERDRSVWEGLGTEPAPLESAEAILCSGLHDDETETPADYAGLIAEGVARNLPLLCANPDIVVDRGEKRIYCAGAIAEAYARAGGRSVYFGKPHPPIYELARRMARRLRPDVSDARLLAAGDGIATDVLGAEQAGIDCLFVSGGLAAVEVGETPDRPDPERLKRWLSERGRAPRYAIGLLG